MTRIEVKQIIKKQIAVTTTEAQKVYDKLKKAVEQDEEITVSFENIKILISHFLNVSIGELYISHKNKWEILDNIKYIGLSDDDLKLLKDRVIPSFKSNPTDKEKYIKIQEEILNKWA